MNNIADLEGFMANLAKQHVCIQDFVYGTKTEILDGVRAKNEYIMLGMEIPYITKLTEKARQYNFRFCLLANAGRDCPELGKDFLVETERILYEIINKLSKGDFEDEDCAFIETSTAEPVCNSYGDGLWGWVVPTKIHLGKKWCVNRNCWTTLCPEMKPQFEFKTEEEEECIILKNTSFGYESFEWFILQEDSKYQTLKEKTIKLKESDFLGSNRCRTSLEVILKLKKKDCCKFARYRLWWCDYTKGVSSEFCPKKSIKKYEKLIDL